jgi:hypothetical protein
VNLNTEARGGDPSLGLVSSIVALEASGYCVVMVDWKCRRDGWDKRASRSNMDQSGRMSYTASRDAQSVELRTTVTGSCGGKPQFDWAIVVLSSPRSGEGVRAKVETRAEAGEQKQRSVRI